MKISLSRAMFETRHELSSISRLLREAETEQPAAADEDDPKAVLKKKAMDAVKKQAGAMEALSTKLTSFGFKATAAAISTAADTMKSLSVESELNEEGVGKFVTSRTLIAALVNLFSGISGEIGEVGEDSEKKTVAELLSNKEGINSLEKTIEANLVPSPGAEKFLKKQNKEFADIFKKEDATTTSQPEETTQKESDSLSEEGEEALSEAGIGEMIGSLLKKFMSNPPKSAKQTVQFVKPLLGDKNLALLIKKDLGNVTYEQYAKFIPSVKGIFIASNPEKAAPSSPSQGEGAVTPDAATKGASVAANSPELVDRIADATEAKSGDSAAAAIEALKKIASGVKKEEAVSSLDPASVEIMKQILGKLASGGANTSPKDVATAVAAVAPSPAAGEGGKTLSSLLFIPKSTKKRKDLGDKGKNIDSAIKELSAAWSEYSDPKNVNFDASKRKEIVTRFKSMKDALSDITTESRDSDEELLIERWQRLAGLK